MNHELQKHRLNSGLSQQQLANKAGLSRQAINSIENRRSQPSLAHAMKLARIFETDVQTLFGKENS